MKNPRIRDVWRNKQSRKNRLLRLIFLSLLNFFVIAAASLLIGAMVIIDVAARTGRPKVLLLVIFLCIVWIFSGSCASAFTTRRSWTPILRLVEAFKEVSKGNFDVELEENSNMPDLANVAKGFNVMVRDLKRTEAFHNDFVANVSHEFKTPIAAIEGYATLLQDENLTKEEQSEYVSKILSNTRRLSTLSGNILKIARLEKQEIVLEKCWFSLDEQIRQALLLHESKWGEKNIEVDIDLDSLDYYWNEELLMQVWVNIFDNAVKFTPEDGTIFARLRSNGENITIEISDTGIGMDDDTVKHIFDKFYQGDKSHYSQGNGLGMTLVKRIIDLCKGTIEIESALGKGTSFRITLPFAANDEDEDE